MAKESLSGKINRLFGENQWAEARKFLVTERANDPESHWVLTQLGVTYYEQQRYKEALQFFLKSKAIVPDCPLTLWNLAGAYDALGKHRSAIRLYTWLLECSTNSDEDPCWESQEWTTALKTDCAYALGASLHALGDRSRAEHWYRQYIDLLLVGVQGSYSLEEVRKKIKSLSDRDDIGRAEAELRKAKAYLKRIRPGKTIVRRRATAKAKT